jgi:hypothetical protein
VDNYTPERTWQTEPVEVEQVVIGAFTSQRRLFTPWPAWDFNAFIERLARGQAPCTVPHPSGLHGWYKPTGMGAA